MGNVVLQEGLEFKFAHSHKSWGNLIFTLAMFKMKGKKKKKETVTARIHF